MPNPFTPYVVPAEGLPVAIAEIRSRFLMLGFFPGGSTNSISPRLVLYPDQLEIKVMKTARHAYADLKRVDYQRGVLLFQPRVILEFRDGTDYYINPVLDSAYRQLLQFFQSKGAVLTAAAQDALAALSNKP